MIYAEHNYLLEMFIFPDVTKEEAFQIAEGVSITPTEETSGENVMRCAVGMTWKMRQKRRTGNG